MHNIITTDVLKTMIPCELEDYRACGEDFRYQLTKAVMRDLNTPERWNMHGEIRSEFGGFFPVQIRFTPSHSRFQLAVCSAGYVSPVWIVVSITASGCPFSVLRTMQAFNPELINQTLRMVARLEQPGYPG